MPALTGGGDAGQKGPHQEVGTRKAALSSSELIIQLCDPGRPHSSRTGPVPSEKQADC